MIRPRWPPWAGIWRTPWTPTPWGSGRIGRTGSGTCGFVDHGDGVTRFGARGDTEAAAVLRAALDPLAAPCPAADGTPDPRTAGQRMFDALIELARRARQHGTLPAGHGVRPHLAVIVSLDTLQHRTTQAGAGRAG